MDIYLLTGDHLEILADLAAAALKHSGELRISVDQGGVKIKVGQGVWSPALGGPDPYSSKAMLAKQAEEAARRNAERDAARTA